MDATTKHFNQLTPAQAEILAWMAEECGEVVKAIGKILRHGLQSSWDGETNQEAFTRELGDLTATIKVAQDNGLVDGKQIISAAKHKELTAGKWLHHVKIESLP